MRARLAARWYDVQDSLWFIPALMTAGAIVLALAMVRLDREVLANPRPETDWLFGAGASGARAVLSAIAGTMITVTGVIFSITVVALQLASSQFTPRVLRTFMGDRGNQLVLGVFIATFTYALLVLRTVREAPEEGAAPFIPSAAVTVGMLLALVSIGFLIYYINHAANSIRAEVVIDRAAGDVLGLIDEHFPSDVGYPPDPPRWDPVDAPTVVRANTGGYLQSINADALFGLDDAGVEAVRVDAPVGSYVLPGEQVAAVWASGPVDDDLQRRVLGALILGPERTLHADLELGIRQVADIAVRALSPGINDPTTAMNCIDRLAELLSTVGRREVPPGVRVQEGHRTRVIISPVTFERLVVVAFDQIRHFGGGDATVARHLVFTLGRIAGILPAERQGPLVEQARLAVASARTQIEVPADLAQVERAARWAQGATDDFADGEGQV